MGKQRQHHAIVIGGSLGGLLAAHQLRALGWKVDVYERAQEDLADRGAGIGTHPALFTALHRVGLTFDASECTVPRSYLCLDRGNRLVHHRPAQRTMTAWSRIYRPLKDHIPVSDYHYGMRLERAETIDGKAVATFADGTVRDADLLIGADGFRSSVRRSVLPDLQPSYSGYIAWRVLVPEDDIPKQTWGLIKDDYVFCVPEGELLVSYPVPTRAEDRARGSLSYNIVWYRPVAERDLPALFVDSTGKAHEMSVPPPLIRPELVTEMKRAAREVLSPCMADVIEACAQPFFQPIYDLCSPSVAIGRVALLGDAAFVARPHVGAGVTKAALDAMGLADCLDAASDIDEALKLYDRQRCMFGSWAVERGALMGIRVRFRRSDEAAPSREELDRRAGQSVEDYIKVALDIEKRTSGTYKTSLRQT